MKTSKTAITIQRKILIEKIGPYLSIRQDRRPPSGWLKAIRGALGMTTRQLAQRLNISHVSIQHFETNEAKGKITLENLDRVAHAMNCKLVYAIVPQESFENIDSILNEQAKIAAKRIVEKVDQTMRLESQGLTNSQLSDRISEIAQKLKETNDSLLWDSPTKNEKAKK